MREIQARNGTTTDVILIDWTAPDARSSGFLGAFFMLVETFFLILFAKMALTANGTAKTAPNLDLVAAAAIAAAPFNPVDIPQRFLKKALGAAGDSVLSGTTFIRFS